MHSILNRLKDHVDYGLLIALVIPIFAIMPLLTHMGLPNTADGPAPPNAASRTKSGLAPR